MHLILRFKKIAKTIYGCFKNNLKENIHKPNSDVNKEENSISSTQVMYKRFLTQNPVAYERAIEAAEKYVSKLEDGEIGWLYSKPFDPTDGNPQYFRLMYDLLNILQAMKIPANARILEIGSGPGWITEILLLLGFSVDAIEPSAEMIKISKDRCAASSAHHRSKNIENVQFFQSTIEEVEFEDNRFDAILFFDALHHIVNEESTINKCFHFLKKGGCLGVVEGAWHPDYKELERDLIAEMDKFGTLENPFTQKYLDQLLTSSGFVDLQRFVGINGYYTKSQINHLMQNFNSQTFAGSNNLVAFKPNLNLTDKLN
jgi:2-polyprenyl-3-methyl-5-hydroxy-6-metoxy-1,4-benzoquinol methylase